MKEDLIGLGGYGCKYKKRILVIIKSILEIVQNY
jgi:hypothetical protein